MVWIVKPIKSNIYMQCTIEPLLKDTPNKGHNTFDLSIYKGQILQSLQDHGITILPLKEDNLSITVKLCQKLLVPKCPLFKGSTVFLSDESFLMWSSHMNSLIFSHDPHIIC